MRPEQRHGGPGFTPGGRRAILEKNRAYAPLTQPKKEEECLYEAYHISLRRGRGSRDSFGG